MRLVSIRSSKLSKEHKRYCQNVWMLLSLSYSTPLPALAEDSVQIASDPISFLNVFDFGVYKV